MHTVPHGTTGILLLVWAQCDLDRAFGSDRAMVESSRLPFLEASPDEIRSLWRARLVRKAASSRMPRSRRHNVLSPSGMDLVRSLDRRFGAEAPALAVLSRQPAFAAASAS